MREEELSSVIQTERTEMAIRLDEIGAHGAIANHDPIARSGAFHINRDSLVPAPGHKFHRLDPSTPSVRAARFQADSDSSGRLTFCDASYSRIAAAAIAASISSFSLVCSDSDPTTRSMNPVSKFAARKSG